MTDGTTPLIALDAAVIDTETTGLDPRSARVVELAMVRIAGGRLEDASFRRLINPGEPIPPAATAVHGIAAATVAGAPAFAAVWPEFLEALGDAIVIGHTVGFDLAVLGRECERAGLAWRQPQTLDTRLLAEIAEPALADFSLESLASWLGITITDRHSALGDARAAAQVFRALLPKLRERNIRTLAEAARACRSLTSVLEQQHRAGWTEAVPATDAANDGARARIDSYPYRHRAGDIMAAARFIPPHATIGEALTDMTKSRTSSLFVGQPGAPADETGIITERDVMRALAADGAAALARPVAQAMSRPLAAVPADAFAYLAVSRMNRLKVRHLGVTDETGKVVGALSARDLLRLRAEGGVQLGDTIDQAKDVHDLGLAWGHAARVAADLAREGLSGREVAAVISRELGAMTHRAAVLAESRMQNSGHGAPPCPYALVVLGSAGRGESLLAMDQDNAIVFADGEPDGPEDRWFAALGAHVADILHEVGVSYCTGGVMAKNAAWRGSLASWRERVRHWIGRSNPQDLLSVDIFFDLRGVHGDTGLANTLWREAFDRAAGEAPFAKLLAETAGAVAPALNWLGRFKTDNGRIDLKKAGLFGIVSTARALAIRHHVVERGTPARLAGLKPLGLGGEADLDALFDAQATFLDLILAQQIHDIAQGIPASNRVEIKRLTRRDRERLHAALEAVAHLDELTRDLLFRE
jgi:DNA polymerase-3 subunit epsilon/CBS domain-containing protein